MSPAAVASAARRAAASPTAGPSQVKLPASAGKVRFNVACKAPASRVASSASASPVAANAVGEVASGSVISNCRKSIVATLCTAASPAGRRAAISSIERNRLASENTCSRVTGLLGSCWGERPVACSNRLEEPFSKLITRASDGTRTMATPVASSSA